MILKLLMGVCRSFYYIYFQGLRTYAVFVKIYCYSNFQFIEPQIVVEAKASPLVSTERLTIDSTLVLPRPLIPSPC
jgi:hypothetical protein